LLTKVPTTDEPEDDADTTTRTLVGAGASS